MSTYTLTPNDTPNLFKFYTWGLSETPLHLELVELICKFYLDMESVAILDCEDDSMEAQQIYTLRESLELLNMVRDLKSQERTLYWFSGSEDGFISWSDIKCSIRTDMKYIKAFKIIHGDFMKSPIMGAFDAIFDGYELTEEEEEDIYEEDLDDPRWLTEEIYEDSDDFEWSVTSWWDPIESQHIYRDDAAV